MSEAVLYRVTFKETRTFTVSVQARDDVEAVQRVAAEYRASRSLNDWEQQTMRGVTAVHWERIERVGGLPCSPTE